MHRAREREEEDAHPRTMPVDLRRVKRRVWPRAAHFRYRIVDAIR